MVAVRLLALLAAVDALVTTKHASLRPLRPRPASRYAPPTMSLAAMPDRPRSSLVLPSVTKRGSLTDVVGWLVAMLTCSIKARKQMLLDQPPPDPINVDRESARLPTPSFEQRRAMLEDGLKHLPAAWAG